MKKEKSPNIQKLQWSNHHQSFIKNTRDKTISSKSTLLINLKIRIKKKKKVKEELINQKTIVITNQSSFKDKNQFQIKPKTKRQKKRKEKKKKELRILKSQATLELFLSLTLRRVRGPRGSNPRRRTRTPRGRIEEN